MYKKITMTYIKMFSFLYMNKQSDIFVNAQRQMTIAAKKGLHDSIQRHIEKHRDGLWKIKYWNKI